MSTTAMLCRTAADAFDIMEYHQALVGALVAFERLDQPILAMKDIGDVQVQPRQAVVVAQRCEDVAGTVGGTMCPLVLAEQHQRLDGGAERPADFRGVAGSFEQRGRLVEQPDRRREVVQEPVCVRPRPKRPRHRDIITEPFRDEKRRLGDRLGLVDIHAHALTHAVGQLLHDGAVDEGGVIVNEPACGSRHRGARRFLRPPKDGKGRAPADSVTGSRSSGAVS